MADLGGNMRLWYIRAASSCQSDRNMSTGPMHADVEDAISR